MRALTRNKKSWAYANYIGKAPIVADGKYTGEYDLTYTEPIDCKGNISPATGNNYTDLFGINVDYDKVIVMTEPDLDISEDSIIWINADTNGANNYIVKRIARSLNSISIAVKRVNVNE